MSTETHVVLFQTPPSNLGSSDPKESLRAPFSPDTLSYKDMDIGRKSTSLT